MKVKTSAKVEFTLLVIGIAFALATQTAHAAAEVQPFVTTTKSDDYTVNQDVNFELSYPQDLVEAVIDYVAQPVETDLDVIDIGYGVQQPPPPVVPDDVAIYVQAPDGKKLDVVDVQVDTLNDGANQDTSTLLHISKQDLPQPGQYKLVVEVNDTTYEKDFTWGVLALNTNKSIYTLGDTANLSMAVLDAEGNMVCDATLILNIKKDGKTVANMRTGDGITVNEEECNTLGFTLKPDYEATYKPSSTGTYDIQLDAITKDSHRTIYDAFKVEHKPDFDIERISATRLYPLAKYPMNINITANKDFSGTFVEFLPADFVYEQQTGVKAFDRYAVENDVAKLEWDVSLTKGESVKLGYTFDSPNISPEIYFAGKYQLVTRDAKTEVEELRFWFFANDAIESADATRLYSTGFELNSTTAGMEYDDNINSPAISSSTKRSGDYALNTAISGSDSTEGIRIQFISADSGNGFNSRVYLYISSLPNQTIEIMEYTNTANTVHMSTRLTSGGKLQLYSNTAGAQVGSDSSDTLTTGTWYRIEMLGDGAAIGAAKLVLRLNGVEVARTTTGNIGGVASSIAKLNVGILTSGQADLYFDDIAINQEGFTGSENWPGEGKIVYLRPNGNGAVDQCSGDYNDVDEVTPNDATDYINCDDADEEDEFTLTDSSTAGIGSRDYIRLAELWTRTSAPATGARTHIVSFVSTSTETNTAISVNSTSWITNDDTLPRNADLTIYNNIGTSNYGPLTPAILDSTAIQVGASTDALPDVYITATWVLVEYIPFEGGRIFSSGFELQSTTAGVEWTSSTGTLGIDTSTYRSGAAALAVGSLSSGTEESLGYAYTASGVNDIGPLYYRTYLYISSAPSAENRIIEVQNAAGTAIAYITLDNSRQLKLYDEDGSIGSVSSALSTSTWYRIELQVSGSGGSDTVEAMIDGAVFATTGSSNLSSGTRSFYVGGNLNSEAQTTGAWLFDDVAINVQRGNLQNSYPGSGKIGHLRPSANGTHTAWTNTYTNVDEVTPNDATDIINTSSVNARESYAMQDASTIGIDSSSSIKFVSTGVRFRNATAVSGIVTFICNSACGTYIESDTLATSTDTWYTNNIVDPIEYPMTAYTQYATSSSWTTTELDAIQLGVRLEVDGGTNAMNVSTLWLLVEYDNTISITGTCDAFDQTTDCGDTGTLKVAVNGTLQGAAQSTVAGTWEIAGVPPPSTNDIITVFIDGASDTDEAVNVSKYDGSGNHTGVTLYKEHLVLGNGQTQTITNTNISQYDNSVSGDEDVFIDVSSGNLTVDSTAQSSTEELYISSSTTYQPGGTVSTHDLENNGTFTAEANTVTISGSLDNNSTFTGSGNFSFSASSGTETIDANGSSFTDLTLGVSSGTATWELADTLDVNDDLTISYGTLDQNTENITVAGDVLIDSNGNYLKDGGTFTFDGTSSATYTNTNSSITHDATSSANTNPDSTSLAWSHTVGSNSNRILVVGIGIRGNNAVSSVTFGAQNLTFAREDHPGSDVRTEIWYLLSPNTGTNTITVTTGSSATITAGAVSYYNVGSVGSAYGDGDSGLSNTSSSVVSSSATGELVFDVMSYQNNSSSLEVGFNQSQRVSRVGTANAVGISEEVGSPSVESTWNFFDNAWAATSLVLRPSATLDNLGTVVFNKTDSVSPSTNNKVTLASHMVTDTVTINGTGGQADTLDLASSNYILEMRNAGSSATVLTIDGTLTVGTSTVKFSATNSGGNVNVNNIAYSSLQISGGDTFVLTGNQTSSNAISGNLTIDYGATLDVTSTPYNITLNGNWNNWGTFTYRTGSVAIGGSGTSTISGPTIFYTFTSTAAGKTIKFQKANYNDSAFEFTNSFVLTGASGNKINLESDTASSQWYADFGSNQTGSTYVNVKDSGCVFGTNTITFDVTSSNVSGNDTSCWLFGSLSADIVDSGGTSVPSPSVAMSTKAFQFSYQTSTGTLGISTEKLRVTNSTVNPQWSLTIAASGGPTAFWDGSSSDYDFNDHTASAGDGSDADSLGGQLSLDPTAGTITPQGGCSTTGITKGSATAFREAATAVTDITLLTAGGSADTSCYWDFTGVGLSQTIPTEQAPLNYDIDLTVTIMAL